MHINTNASNYIKTTDNPIVENKTQSSLYPLEKVQNKEKSLKLGPEFKSEFSDNKMGNAKELASHVNIKYTTNLIEVNFPNVTNLNQVKQMDCPDFTKFNQTNDLISAANFASQKEAKSALKESRIKSILGITHGSEVEIPANLFTSNTYKVLQEKGGNGDRGRNFSKKFSEFSQFSSMYQKMNYE